MGYRCPVCEVHQPDGEHLADHVAVTALLHGDGHADWLDARAPGWDERGRRELVPIVTDGSRETDTERPSATMTPEGRRPVRPRTSPAGSPAGDETVEAVLREARELTEEMGGRDGE